MMEVSETTWEIIRKIHICAESDERALSSVLAGEVGGDWEAVN